MAVRCSSEKIFHTGTCTFLYCCDTMDVKKISQEDTFYLGGPSGKANEPELPGEGIDEPPKANFLTKTQNYIYDFYNINIILNFIINAAGMTVREVETNIDQRDPDIYLMKILDSYSYRAKVLHFTLLADEKEISLLLKEYLEKTLSNRKVKIFFSQKNGIAGQTNILKLPGARYEYSPRTSPYDYLEKQLTALRYGEEGIPCCFENINEKVRNGVGAFMKEMELKTEKYKELSRIFVQLFSKKRRFFNCSAGINSLTLDLKTGIWKGCLRAGKSIGNLPEGLDNEERHFYFLRSMDAFSKCSGCWARYLCGGGCSLGSFLSCSQIEKMFSEVIYLYLLIYENNPGIIEKCQKLMRSHDACLLSPFSDALILEK